MFQKLVLASLFVGTVFGANWAITHYGVIGVGFGYQAPAGVLFAGLAFTLRDLLHESGGRKWVLAAILLGAVSSFLIEDGRQFAIASAVAFTLSETIDFAIYEPLRHRHWLGAVALSNTFGLVVDSVIFLWLAFGNLDFLPGQLIGKAYMTILAVAGLYMWKRMRS